MKDLQKTFLEKFVNIVEEPTVRSFGLHYFKDNVEPGNLWVWINESFEPKEANPVDAVVSQAASQAVPEPNANEQKILFDSIKDKILASLLKDIPYWDLKNDDINECIENVKELFASM